MRLFSKKFTSMGLMLYTCKTFQVRKIYFLSLEKDFWEMMKNYEIFVALEIFKNLELHACWVFYIHDVHIQWTYHYSYHLYAEIEGWWNGVICWELLANPDWSLPLLIPCSLHLYFQNEWKHEGEAWLMVELSSDWNAGIDHHGTIIYQNIEISTLKN